MLGKDHLKISLMFSIPFILYSIICVVHFDLPIYIAIIFPLCISIGCLIPDADCGGKSSLYYKHQGIFFLMIPIYKFVLFTTRFFVKKYPNHLIPAEEEHRGILHSFSGILLSSFLLSMIFSAIAILFLYLMDSFNLGDIFSIFISVFSGLLLGQFLHLVEDSCTKSGIKIFLPFSSKVIKGEISTKSERTNELIDIRPRYFSKILRKTSAICSIFLLFIWVYSSEYVIHSLFIILFIQCLTLLYLYSLSQDKSRKWYRNRKELNKIERDEAKRRKNEMDKFF